jgi:hypothetical protein
LITFGPGDNRGVKTSIVEGLVHPKPFVATDDGIAAGEPTECFNPITVVMRAEALSGKEGHVGAVAFGRTDDPATGDFSDAKVIRKFGDVPDDLSTL